MSNIPERVDFEPYQILKARDFRDEQSYHLSMRWRHHLGLHPWGIVKGLLLAQDEGQIRVQPGLAVDGYGRELVLSAAVPVPDLDPRVEKGPLDVWLEYGRECLPPAGKVGAGRLRERPTVTTTRKALRPVADDGRQPPGVPKEDISFAPELQPPDDPGYRWPVFLGTIQFQKPSAQDPGQWTIDLAGRPYVRAVAGAVISPSSRLPPGPAGADQIPAPGAVLGFDERDTTPPEAAPSVNVRLTGSDGSSTTPLSLDARYLTFRGDQVFLENDLIVAGGGALQFQPNNKVEDGKLPPGAAPEPWRIYHNVTRPQKDPGAAQSPATGAGTASPAADDVGSDELRVVLPVDTDKVTNRVTIGYFDPDGKAFKPVLQIGNQTTILYGNLVMQNGVVVGQTVTAPGAIPPTPGGESGFITSLLAEPKLRQLAITEIVKNHLQDFAHAVVPKTAGLLQLLLNEQDGDKQVADALSGDALRQKFVNALGGKAQAVVEAMFDGSAPADYPKQVATAVAKTPSSLAQGLEDANKIGDVIAPLVSTGARMTKVAPELLRATPLPLFADYFGKAPLLTASQTTDLTALVHALIADPGRLKVVRDLVIPKLDATAIDLLVRTLVIDKPQLGQGVVRRLIIKAESTGAGVEPVPNDEGIAVIGTCLKGDLLLPLTGTAAQKLANTIKAPLRKLLIELRRQFETTPIAQPTDLYPAIVDLAQIVANTNPLPPK